MDISVLGAAEVSAGRVHCCVVLKKSPTDCNPKSVDYLEKTGQRNSSLYEVAQLAAKNGGYYDLLKQVVWMFPNGMPEVVYRTVQCSQANPERDANRIGVPLNFPQDIQANRSVMVCPTHSLPHLSSTRPNGIFSKARLYIGKEAIFN